MELIVKVVAQWNFTMPFIPDCTTAARWLAAVVTDSQNTNLAYFGLYPVSNVTLDFQLRQCPIVSNTGIIPHGFLPLQVLFDLNEPLCRHVASAILKTEIQFC